MDNSDIQSQIYAFGPFHLVPDEYLLIRSDEQIELEPMVFDTLVLLVKHQGRLVKKSEFNNSLWPKITISDWEGRLQQIISILRTILGDDPDHPIYIETVRRRGYRFIAEVKIFSNIQEISYTRLKRINPLLSGQALQTDQSSHKQAAPPQSSQQGQAKLVEYPQNVLSKAHLFFGGHLQYVVIWCCLYTSLYVISVFLEVAYKFDTLGSKVIKGTPLAFIWILFTSITGAGVDWKLTSQGKRNGEVFAFLIFLAASIILSGWLSWSDTLPPLPVTESNVSTYPALAAHWKNSAYFIIVATAYFILPFHFQAATQRALRTPNSNLELNLLLNKWVGTAPLGAIYIKPSILLYMLILALVSAQLGTHYVTSNLKTSPYQQLFILLYYARILLWFVCAFAGLFWYHKELNKLKDEYVTRTKPNVLT